MEIDINHLPQSPQLLEKIIVDLQSELILYKEYKAKYYQLIEEIRLAKQHRFAPSSEKNTFQKDLFDEAGVALPEEVQAQLKDEIEVTGHHRKKHPVRRPLPADIPREIVIHDLPEAERICLCGTALIKIGEETSEQLKYIPAQLSVVQHVRYKYACKPCQDNVKTAPMPVLLLPKSIATPELVAHTIVSKYEDHLPLYRQESIWRRLDIDIPRSSLCGWIMKTAELCEPLIALLQAELIAHGYTQADETPVQVLNEQGRDNTTSSYMWVYRGGDRLHPSIVFDYQATRGGHHAKAFLTGFTGYLQTDAYSGYRWAEKEAAIIQVGCCAHARRPFAQLAKLTTTTGIADEALEFFKQLYAIEKQARENQLSPEARYQLRQSKAPPICEAFKTWLMQHLPKTPEQSKLGKALRYSVQHWDALMNYLKDGCIEIDNNAVENQIRPFAIGRKNFLFMGSPRGAKAGATLYSLLQTCKANQIEPYRYFCTMLPQIRLCKTDNDYKKLLPQFISL